MHKILGIVIALSLLTVFGCSGQQGQDQPAASSSPAGKLNQEQHMSGNKNTPDTSAPSPSNLADNHISGVSPLTESESHLSGN
ncbi:MAG: hypothetical protein ACE5E9_07145 [Nitrospinaceae bacterium]